jgi:transposase
MWCVGVDVSKKKLDSALLIDPERVKVRTKAVANTPSGFEQLIAFACRHARCEPGSLHFVMEATGVYHEAAALALHRAGATVSVANPAQVRDFAKGLAVRTKTDAKDSVVLARYGHLAKPRAWVPPPEAVLALKSLIRRIEAIETDILREHNRLEKAEVANAPAPVRDSLKKSLAFLEQQKAELERLIDDHIDRHPELKEDQALLRSIPAIGPKVSRRMISLLRSRPFNSAAQAAAFTGLVPVHHQSGESVRSPSRLSKNGDAGLRRLLYMAAVVAIRHNPDVRALYQRLRASGKSKMSALGAAMRKLVHICYGVLKHQRPYQPQNTINA